MSNPGTSKSGPIQLDECPIPAKLAKTQDLVQILITDLQVLKEWSQFSDSLDCPLHQKLVWERGILNGTLSYCELFSKILGSWTSRNKNNTVQELAGILKRMKCISIAEKLEDQLISTRADFEIIIQHEEDSTHRLRKRAGRGLTAVNDFVRSKRKIKHPFVHGLLVPASNFSGREEELEKLKTNFNSNNNNLMLICGIGGIGKTELCKKFANDINLTCDDFKFKPPSRIWLQGETLETLETSVLDLSKELGVTYHGGTPAPSEYFEYLASMILENCNRLLVVIDNVDVTYPEVTKIVKSVQKSKYAGGLFVVVTSRNSLVLDNAGITIQLDPLINHQARSLLQKSIPTLTDLDSDNLANLVQCFPLALQQAIAYIKQQRNNFRTQNYTVSNYIRDFQGKKSQMLGQTLNEFEHNNSTSTLVTWDTTVSKLNENAFAVLKIISYLEPDKILVEFLERICIRMNIRDFDDGLNMILSSSLVKLEGKDINVHRLVQQVVIGKIENFEFSKRLFDCVFLEWGKYDRLNEERFYVEGHLKSVYKLAWKSEFHLFEKLPREFSFRLTKDFNFGIPQVLSFLLKHDRLECAFEFTKIHFPHIQLSNSLKTKDFIEKVFIWSLVNQSNLVTNEMMEMGVYNVTICLDNLNNQDLFVFELLEECLQISEKFFGKRGNIAFEIRKKLFKVGFCSGEIERVISLYEEFINFPISKQEKHFENLNHILWKFENDKNEGEEERLSSQIDRVHKIIDNFCEIYKDEKIRLEELKAKVLDLKGEFKKAYELFKQVQINFEQLGNVGKIHEINCKLIELEIKLIDCSIVTKVKIEKQFSAVDYSNISFRGLKRILVIYETVLGVDHPLTVRVKIAMHKLTIDSRN